jgi:ABC-type enterochelin transport system permease subunit
LGNFRIRFLFDPIWNVFEIPVDSSRFDIAQVNMFALFSSVAAMLGSPGQVVTDG